MTFQLNLPPSAVAKLVKSEECADEPKKQSREDWRKMKELEEMRKAGTAEAMKDEEGKDINPHIPQYIMQAPWYYGATTPTLGHQRPLSQNDAYAKYEQMYKKGVKEGLTATKFRKGACENCGSMTHKKKDCLERPRKVGARFTGDNIAPDEYIPPEATSDYDGKRDRWNNCDLEEHQTKLFTEYEKIEEAKRVLKEVKLEQSLLEGTADDEKAADSDNEDKYAEEMDMPGQKFETKQRITVRNLRIREDTAKYLYNLDLNSAFYDPKTRSMRENPFNKKGDGMDAEYGGDNFVRGSGDAADMASEQLFAWQAFERGTDVHLQADPTKLELLHREYHDRKEDFKQSVKGSILQKYGGQEHLETPPKELLLAQTEDYVEYSRHGSVIKGMERAKVLSHYEEDIYPNNHTCVWGSYWKDGLWGFQCCHSLIKGSYCTGDAGKQTQEVDDDVLAIDLGRESEKEEKQSSEEEVQESQTEKKKKKKKKKRKKRKHKKRVSSSESSDSESDSEEAKQKKLKKALEKEAAYQKEMDKVLATDERKRKYNSMYEARAPTEEEMEAYRMKRSRMEDPMVDFLSK
ncbi:pre-mRNA-splicing factor SLU7-like [Gigantopelta aegis]|uniref:pre-mRNA-splicing factor SLU7-like n=1 Tax=Gigantopelta aegis TaxID=1735272 RepID=UPI001B88C271|nr:pre-mRNA-splicing factor SLU7-like [Gigantopelta aegis]XP_041370104.1 pre-mRNA-splicing factor SLU7-like [Gigantopelta aegis]XP_041370105.1 pre-mRNA-splicing factor SLU7-like [Gigantopelta aegis]